MIRMMMCWY